MKEDISVGCVPIILMGLLLALLLGLAMLGAIHAMDMHPTWDTTTSTTR